MKTVADERLIYEILSVVEEIPCGKVASYGQIARLIGRELKYSDRFGEYPCHRVVNSVGRLAPGFFEQRELLLDEGVEFLPNGCVDMKKYRWEC